MPGEESSFQMHGQTGKYGSATSQHSVLPLSRYFFMRKRTPTHLNISKHSVYKHETPIQSKKSLYFTCLNIIR